jgi:hypothetical protein
MAEQRAAQRVGEILEINLSDGLLGAGKIHGKT